MKKLEKIWKISGIIAVVSIIGIVLSIAASAIFPQQDISNIFLWISTGVFVLAFAVNMSSISKQPPL